MEQERTIFQVKDVSKLTGEMLLKMLAYMVEYMTDLDRLKAYLEEYKIGFATQALKDNRVMLAFEVKNKELVKKAYEQFLTDLTSPQETKKLTQELLKSPENMNLEEKITHFKVQEQVKIQAVAEKAPKITKTSPKEVTK